jgi:ABC-type bacteriocin/lantibiotic exporter with double-glycine peptidase domain
VFRQLVEVENNMSAVERIVYYARDLEQEPPHEMPEAKPTVLWPGEGRLEIKDAVLKYRPELPLVLKGLSMSVEGGEKIGIVGRLVAFLKYPCVTSLLIFPPFPIGLVLESRPS